MDVPDSTWQGWDWPAGDAVLLQVERESDLPQLSQLIEPDDSWCQLLIANRPAGVCLLAPGDGRWTASDFAAEVHGFIDDASRFWAQVRSSTSAGRDTLLGALATLLVDSAY